jgi:MYXO-CTERM domain-containing protein
MRSNKSKSMTKCAAGAMLFGGTLAATQAVASTIVIDNFTSSGSLTAAQEYDANSSTTWLPSGVLNVSGGDSWNTSSWTTHSSFQGRRQLWSSTRQGYEVDYSSYDPTTYSYTGVNFLNNNNNGSGVSGGSFAVKTYNPALQSTPWVGASTVQVGTQYLLDAAMDLTGKSIVLRGAGTGIGQPNGLGSGGLAVWITLFTGASDTDAAAFAGYGGSRLSFTGSQTFGDLTFDLSNVGSYYGTFNLSSVNAIQITFESYNGTGGGLGASGWDYSMTGVEVVPAPGAAVLLGLAGLGGRRRRS